MAKMQDPQLSLLKDMFVSLLLLHGVPQKNAAAVVGMDLNRANAVSKLLRSKKSKN
jgi:hypothetical protein